MVRVVRPDLVFVMRLLEETVYVSVLILSGQPLSAVEVTQSHGLTEGKTRV